ncbi:MAG: DUF4231 domain-containing protein, partial [Thaumarchaeota archaeon]|nr:DUF4231 domain-containing protein [Nitrososphaerota archaeon]
VGAVVVVVESIVHLNQYQHNWLVYRATCEELKHEKYLYEAGAGAYATAEYPARMLAERVEGLISKEHAKWVSSREEENKGRRER